MTHSPGDEQTDVPTTWHGQETPDPLTVHDEVGRKTGYPLLVCGWEKDGRITVTSFTLSENGTAIPGFVNEPANDPHLTNTAIFLPRKSLLPNTTYTATFKGGWTYADGSRKPLNVTWSFTTAP